MKISLICATYGRSVELDFLLNSLQTQNYKNFEIIIVDQNKDGLIDSTIEKYKNTLSINHVKSEKIGLSINRNIGIKAAKGEILAFPDDDCTYYPDTLEKVISLFNTHKYDLILGQIYDRDAKKAIIRNWPKYSFEVRSIRNILGLATSITIFCKNQKAFFDESFGIGSKFGAYEDSDLCAQYLKNGRPLLFNPSIEVLHPEGNTILDANKSHNYGLGWGAFFAKHLDLKTSLLFILIITYVVIMFIRDILLLRPTTKNRFYSLKGRINGFFDYLINYKFRRNNS